MNKQGLTLNNPQRLIYHKTKPNQTKSNHQFKTEQNLTMLTFMLPILR